MIIIVKNLANFTYANKLLKKPCVYFAKKSKSKFLVSKGDFTINIQFPKNVFYYDEPIPYEIKLDLRNLKIFLTELEVQILRHKRQNQRLNFQKAEKIVKDILFSKFITVDKGLKEYLIQDAIKFPKAWQNEIGVYPPDIYNSIDKKIQ